MDFYKKIILFLLIGFLFRIFIIFCLPVRTFEKTIKRYHYIAVNLLEGNGYSHFNTPPYEPSFYKPPVYPIFLAVIYKLFGVSLNTVRIIQAMLDSLGCLLLFYLGRHYFNDKIAFTIFALAIFCPITAVYTNLINPESLTLFLMTLSLWFVSKASLSGKPLFFFASGLSITLMAYTRQEFLPFILIFGIYLFILHRKALASKIVLYSLAVIIIITPWIIRNYIHTNRVIPFTIAGGLGLTLWYGTLGDTANDEASLNKFFHDNPEIKIKQDEWYEKVLYGRRNIDDKIEADRYFMEMAINKIKRNPFKYLIINFMRMPRVWLNLHADEFTFLNSQKLRLFHPNFEDILKYGKEEPKEIIVLFMKYMFFVINGFYILMVLKGLWVLRKRLLQFSFMILPLIYAQTFFFFIHIAPNYTIPYWSCIIFFSGVGFYYSFISKIFPELSRT